MVAIIDFEIPATAFTLGDLFKEFPEITIELERVIPLNTGVMPLVWVGGIDPDTLQHKIQQSPLVAEVTQLAHADDRYLFEIEWNPESDSLIRSLIDNEADLLRVEGNPETWRFRVQFRTHDHLVAFRTACQNHDHPLTVNRLDSPRLAAGNDRLTDTQREALLAAYTAGYWNVPRGTDLTRLGEELDISDAAVSQRLRRGINTVIEEFVLPDAEG